MPGNVFKEKCEFDTLEEIIEHYLQFKIAVKNYYFEDKMLKDKHPSLYKRLTRGELNEIEIRKMTEHFYMKKAEELSKALTTDEYELE